MSAKILVVDDEPNIVAVLQARLEHLGYQVISAANGVEALEKVEKERPDLVILDVLMPEMSGYHFMEALKAKRETIPPIPIIVISARPKMEQLFEPWNIYCFLPKPFEAKDFVARVALALESAPKSVAKDAAPAAPSPAPSTGKIAVVLGVEDFIVRKVKNFLEFRGFQTEVALDEKEALKLAFEKQPAFILAQFWEDPATLDALWVYHGLSRKRETQGVAFAVFCRQDLCVDVAKHLAAWQILGFVNSDELINKLDRFVGKYAHKAEV